MQREVRCAKGVPDLLRLVLDWFIPVFRGMGFGLIAMVLHEAGHLVVAFLLGLHIYRFGVNWKGMYVVREAGPLASNILVSLAGPLTNLLLSLMWYRSASFSLANLCFGLVNLLPIQASDGDRILRAIEDHKRNRPASE